MHIIQKDFSEIWVLRYEDSKRLRSHVRIEDIYTV